MKNRKQNLPVISILSHNCKLIFLILCYMRLRSRLWKSLLPWPAGSLLSCATEEGACQKRIWVLEKEEGTCSFLFTSYLLAVPERNTLATSSPWQKNLPLEATAESSLSNTCRIYSALRDTSTSWATTFTPHPIFLPERSPQHNGYGWVASLVAPVCDLPISVLFADWLSESFTKTWNLFYPLIMDCHCDLFGQ